MHFTYSDCVDRNNLSQGDVLIITEELREVLSQHHPYFVKEKYKYFIVITQSCDLVRRKGICCKSPYITLAAVRTYDDFINRVSKDMCVKDFSGLKLLDDNSSEKFLQLLERLFNNNETDYFFLYQEPALRFNENMVAYLKVSFALKSELHYDKCLSAKVLELGDEFKAKLGWLVGQMYSKVGTKDWESLKTRNDFIESLRVELKERFVISSKEKLKEFKKRVESEGLTFSNNEEAYNQLNDLVIKSKYDTVMEMLETIIARRHNLGTESERETLIRLLRSNTGIKNLIK